MITSKAPEIFEKHLEEINFRLGLIDNARNFLRKYKVLTDHRISLCHLDEYPNKKNKKVITSLSIHLLWKKNEEGDFDFFIQKDTHSTYWHQRGWAGTTIDYDPKKKADIFLLDNLKLDEKLFLSQCMNYAIEEIQNNIKQNMPRNFKQFEKCYLSGVKREKLKHEEESYYYDWSNLYYAYTRESHKESEKIKDGFDYEEWLKTLRN